MSNNCKTIATKVITNLAKKVAESAVHAAVFAYVSNKVSKFMDPDKKKVRVEDTTEEPKQ